MFSVQCPGFLVVLSRKNWKKHSHFIFPEVEVCRLPFYYLFSTWHLACGIFPKIWDIIATTIWEVSFQATQSVWQCHYKHKVGRVTSWIQRLAVLFWAQARMTKTQSFENSCHHHNIYHVCTILALVLVVTIIMKTTIIIATIFGCFKMVWIYHAIKFTHKPL